MMGGEPPKAAPAALAPAKRWSAIREWTISAMAGGNDI